MKDVEKHKIIMTRSIARKINQPITEDYHLRDRVVVEDVGIVNWGSVPRGEVDRQPLMASLKVAPRVMKSCTQV
jgi:hypothetical protein